jgi:hypothetical protein
MVNSVHFGEYGWDNINQMLDPAFNVKTAYMIYQQRGWNAWYAVEGILW